MNRHFWNETNFSGLYLLLFVALGCSGTAPDSACSSNAVGATSGTNPCASGGATSTGGTSASVTSSGGASVVGGASSTGGSSAVGAVGTLGQPCASPGQLGCAGLNQRLGLVCGASYTWQVNQTCNGDLVCDARPGATAGTCQTPDAGCVNNGAGVSYCVSKALWACDIYGIRATLQTDCSTNGTCVSGACFVYKPGTKGFHDSCTYSESTTGVKACNALDPTMSLKCDGTQWVLDSYCTGNDLCDSPPGATPGHTNALRRRVPPLSMSRPARAVRNRTSSSRCRRAHSAASDAHCPKIERILELSNEPNLGFALDSRTRMSSAPTLCCCGTETRAIKAPSGLIAQVCV